MCQKENTRTEEFDLLEQRRVLMPQGRHVRRGQPGPGRLRTTRHQRRPAMADMLRLDVATGMQQQECSSRGERSHPGSFFSGRGQRTSAAFNFATKRARAEYSRSYSSSIGRTLAATRSSPSAPPPAAASAVVWRSRRCRLNIAREKVACAGNAGAAQAELHLCGRVVSIGGGSNTAASEELVR